MDITTLPKWAQLDCSDPIFDQITCQRCGRKWRWRVGPRGESVMNQVIADWIERHLVWDCPETMRSRKFLGYDIYVNDTYVRTDRPTWRDRLRRMMRGLRAR